MAAFLLSTWRQGHRTLSECRPWLWRLLIQKVVQVASHTTFSPGCKVGDLSDLGGWRRVALDLTNACGGTGCYKQRKIWHGLTTLDARMWVLICLMLLWLVHPMPYHITIIENNMNIYHVVSKNRQATIEIYWTTDSSCKNSALATKTAAPKFFRSLNVTSKSLHPTIAKGHSLNPIARRLNISSGWSTTCLCSQKCHKGSCISIITFVFNIVWPFWVVQVPLRQPHLHHSKSRTLQTCHVRWICCRAT